MLGRIYAIGLNTFREAVRSKLLYAILFFAILLILFSMVFGELSLYEQERVIKDLGIVVITLFATLIAIYTGVSLLHKEIDKKTLYTILSKPIQRWEFLIGKFFGILITMAVELAIMSAIFLLLLYLRDIPLTQTLFQALLLIFAEVTLVASIAMVFSAFSTPFLSGAMTALLFVLGHLHDSIQAFGDSHPSRALRSVLAIADLLLPDLTLFNLSREVTHNLDVTWAYVGNVLAFGVTYTALLLILAAVIFRRRDFI